LAGIKQKVTIAITKLSEIGSQRRKKWESAAEKRLEPPTRTLRLCSKLTPLVSMTLLAKRTKHHGVSAIDPQRVAKRSWFRSNLRESVLLVLISYFAMSILNLTASGYKKTKDTADVVGGYGGESVSQPH